MLPTSRLSSGMHWSYYFFWRFSKSQIFQAVSEFKPLPFSFSVDQLLWRNIIVYYYSVITIAIKQRKQWSKINNTKSSMLFFATLKYCFRSYIWILCRYIYTCLCRVPACRRVLKYVYHPCTPSRVPYKIRYCVHITILHSTHKHRHKHTRR